MAGCDSQLFGLLAETQLLRFLVFVLVVWFWFGVFFASLFVLVLYFIFSISSSDLKWFSILFSYEICSFLGALKHHKFLKFLLIFRHWAQPTDLCTYNNMSLKLFYVLVIGKFILFYFWDRVSPWWLDT